MTLLEELKQLDAQVKNEIGDKPFDQGIIVLRKRLWDIADRRGMSGADVFQAYMDWWSSNK